MAVELATATLAFSCPRARADSSSCSSPVEGTAGSSLGSLAFTIGPSSQADHCQYVHNVSSVYGCRMVEVPSSKVLSTSGSDALWGLEAVRPVKPSCSAAPFTQAGPP
eukprot:CAMPEP_0206583706 /NCGR_PEP_ID=MMETSP0325_2-20121206/35266_1 /ASSEMBLY_ACC=CAM_ASM_000347 /TAXON_ID=2866 /ORGANISM="Crypthecodinium cohnii, Strain Seligo" /LENGTH=107 /DNA_ID=CAMNT_0054090683 /DNA_START=79 /DNA_END=402 /DNA_ORIENTATION=-